MSMSSGLGRRPLIRYRINSWLMLARIEVQESTSKAQHSSTLSSAKVSSLTDSSNISISRESNNSTSFQTNSIALRSMKYLTVVTAPLYELRIVCLRIWPTNKRSKFSQTSILQIMVRLHVAVIRYNNSSNVFSNLTTTGDSS